MVEIIYSLAENIFLNLNYPDLKKCQLINQSTSQILDNPMFWIRILIENGLSKENQKEIEDWIRLGWHQMFHCQIHDLPFQGMNEKSSPH